MADSRSVRHAKIRADKVERAHASSPQTWRSVAGGRLRDTEDLYTLKFTAWHHVKGDGEPSSRWGHMTVKWGRGNDAVYTDYRSGGPKADFAEPIELVDKTSASGAVRPVSGYDALVPGLHTPTEHATRFTGRPHFFKGSFRGEKHNARRTMRVQVTREEFTALNESLMRAESEQNYSAFREADGHEGKRMLRCMSPLEHLAAIKGMEFGGDVTQPRDYMAAFQERFPEVSSRIHKRTYGDPTGEGTRVRTDSGAGRSRRPVVKMDTDYWK